MKAIDNKELILSLEELEKERGIKKDYLLEAIETALVTAYKRNFDSLENVKVVMDRQTGATHVYSIKEVMKKGYDIRNAQIKGAELTMENHGCISFDVVVEGAGWGCVFGGYSLGHGYLGAKEFSGYGPGMESIARIMDTVGVTKLSDLKGRYIRAAAARDRRLKIIGNIINDKWFDIESFFKDAQENDNKVSEGSNK